MNTNIVGWVMLGIALLGQFSHLVWQKIKTTELVEWKKHVDDHMANTDKHIDLRRDEQRWTELTKKIDRMEKKLDNLSASERAIITKLNKGDSEDA